MTASVQLIFAASWLQLDRSQPDTSGQDCVHETRCGRHIRLERGRCEGHPAIWVDWAVPQASPSLFKSQRRDHGGLAVAFAAAVEASPEAHHWLLLLSHMPSPRSQEVLEERIHMLIDNTMVTWRSPSNDLIAAGFSGEMYSELIRLDSAHALDRLLRRYPCLQLGEPAPPLLQKEHSPSVNR